MSQAPTHRCETVHLSRSTRRATGSLQWLLEMKDIDPPIHYGNRFEILICGQKAFARIADDIRKARHSIDIVCWGFDPAMELERSGSQWPRGATFGALLEQAAERGVQVRLLAWYGFVGSWKQNNMPGHSHHRPSAEQRAGLQGVWVNATGAFEPAWDTPTPAERREDFNADWYRKAFGGRQPNLFVRTRDGARPGAESTDATSTDADRTRLGLREKLLLERFATHHQKTLLIDYEGDGGAHAVGYVMGLNSVSDYWDTEQHLSHDPLRAAGWEGHGDGQATLKPYQDYACRLRGPALTALEQNFTSAWNRAQVGPGGGADLPCRATPPRLGQGLQQQVSPGRVQIVRTQPEEGGEQSIRRLYRHASSFARHYLYIENQYFQDVTWARQLKAERKAYVQAWKAAGQPLDKLPWLHVMLVIPTPEDDAMVPRTHDSLKELGLGESIPGQNAAVEREIAQHRAATARYEDDLRRHQRSKAFHDANVDRLAGTGGIGQYSQFTLQPPTPPAALSPVAASFEASGGGRPDAQIQQELATLGIRTLAASLWSCDDRSPLPKGASRYREIYIHSKLMIIDDSMFTLGSANLNLRSMAVDSELNVATDDPKEAEALRRRVWALHSGGSSVQRGEVLDGGSGRGREMEGTFKKWGERAKDNFKEKREGRSLRGFLVNFHATGVSTWRAG